METQWLSSKEKVQSAAVNKWGHTYPSVTWKDPLLDFLKKDTVVNSASYCQSIEAKFTLFIEWPLYNMQILLDFFYIHIGFLLYAIWKPVLLDWLKWPVHPDKCGKNCESFWWYNFLKLFNR